MRVEDCSVLALGYHIGHDTKQKEDTTCDVLGLHCKPRVISRNSIIFLELVFILIWISVLNKTPAISSNLLVISCLLVVGVGLN